MAALGLALAACGGTGSTTTVPEPDSTTTTTTISTASTTTSTPTPATSTTTTVEAEDETPTFEIDVVSGAVSGGGRLQVSLGSVVRLVVLADVSDEIHVHGYDLFALVAPGQPATLEFTADIPGCSRWSWSRPVSSWPSSKWPHDPNRGDHPAGWCLLAVRPGPGLGARHRWAGRPSHSSQLLRGRSGDGAGGRIMNAQVPAGGVRLSTAAQTRLHLSPTWAT